MLVFGRLHRVAIRIIDVENNFAKDEALSRFMFIWRRNSHGSASWRMHSWVRMTARWWWWCTEFGVLGKMA
jgi:hypothetical protein